MLMFLRRERLGKAVSGHTHCCHSIELDGAPLYLLSKSVLMNVNVMQFAVELEGLLSKKANHLQIVT